MKKVNFILLVSILVLIIILSVVVIFIYDKDSDVVEFVAENNGSEIVPIIDEENREEVIELSFEEKTLNYDSSQKVLDLINSFDIIARDNVLFPADSVYDAKEGTEYDLLRLANNILLDHQIQAVIFVYDYGVNVNAVVNFRDIEKPMYYYFEDGMMKMAHHGWSFVELIAAEESRMSVDITRYGVLFEGDVRGDGEINIMEVEDWEQI